MDSLKTAMTEAAEAMERELDRLIPRGTGHEKRVYDAMRYASLEGGKRLRPFLVIESARLFDVPRARALRAAAAIEFVHCYSLVHDDLPAMDNDDLRRGRPTVHKKFDDATAILAGDALLTLAFEVLAHPDTHPDGAVRAEQAGGQPQRQRILDDAGAGQQVSHPHRFHPCYGWRSIRRSLEPSAPGAGR